MSFRSVWLWWTFLFICVVLAGGSFIFIEKWYANLYDRFMVSAGMITAGSLFVMLLNILISNKGRYLIAGDGVRLLRNNVFIPWFEIDRFSKGSIRHAKMIFIHLKPDSKCMKYRGGWINRLIYWLEPNTLNLSLNGMDCKITELVAAMEKLAPQHLKKNINLLNDNAHR